MPRLSSRIALTALAVLTAALAFATASAGAPSDPDEAIRCSDAGTALTLGPAGRVLVGGSTFTNEVIEEPSGDHGHVGDFSVLRFSGRGALDRSFGDQGHADVDVGDFDDLADLATDTRGRVLAAGSTRNIVDGGLGPFDIAVWRHRKNGPLDGRFGDDGSSLLDLGGSERAEAIATDRRGRVLVAGVAGEEDGSGARALVARLSADGSFDSEFGQDGLVLFDELEAFDSVHVDRSGRITLGGHAELDGSVATAVVRLTDDGSENPGFGDRGTALMAWPGLQSAGGGALTLDRNGRVVAATAATDGANEVIGTVRLTRAGQLDPGWGEQGRSVLDLPSANDAVSEIVATRSGELLIAGAGYSADFATGDGYLAKLSRSGRLDLAFGQQGLVRERFGLDYSALNGLGIQPDGSIFAAGWNFSEAPDALPDSDVALVRYRPDGRRDPAFGRRGLVLADIQGAPVCERFDHDHDHEE